MSDTFLLLIQNASVVDGRYDLLPEFRMTFVRSGIGVAVAPEFAVDHEFQDIGSVLMAPLIAAGIALVLGVAHDGLYDGSVCQFEINQVSYLDRKSVV